MTTVHVAIQRASRSADCPTDDEITSWARYAVQQTKTDNMPVELNVRLVDIEESAELNQSYRNKEGATNVLSFPFDTPPGYPDSFYTRLLGDIVICAPVVAKEAKTQHKPLHSHWAHMVIHGVLHLLGYDHQQDEEATRMETQETELLAHFKITNPYRETIN